MKRRPDTIEFYALCAVIGVGMVAAIVSLFR
jgi:hypothetical protein